MTIRELINKGRGALVGRKTELLDAELLLAYVIGEKREYLLAHDDEDVADELVDLFIAYVNRVRDGEPIAYILGEKEFYGLSFYVDSRVLIPRPETELLVDKVVEFLRKQASLDNKFRIADVGTGSGNIATAIAKTLIDSGLLDHIDAFDCSADALDVCRINVAQHGVEHLVCVSESDLMDSADEGQKYDIIVANLPYIGRDTNRYISLDTEKYEPEVALFGGLSGLELYDRMFAQIRDKKIDYRVIFGEFGFAQSEDIKKLLEKYFTGQWELEKDLAGICRVFTVERAERDQV